jgi:hypothetical protein
VAETACPACGETEDLRGRASGEDIEVECLTCGTSFDRGTPRCCRCGRTDPVHGSQRMTRFARGMLLAVVGMREVPLCRSCDGDVVALVLDRGQLIPEGYASRFLRGEVDVTLSVAPKATPRAAPTPPPSAKSPIVSALRRPAQAPTPPPDQTKLLDPTVRQATEAVLNQAQGPTDSLCLVLLGTELGASTRLSRLDEQTAESLRRWVRAKFGEASTARRDTAEATIKNIVDHWLREGWLAVDIAADIR